MILFYDSIVFLSTFLFAVVAAGFAYLLMKRLGAMDVPNERSNHAAPTPRGGGLGMMFAILSFLVVTGAPATLVMGTIALTAISFADDLRPIAPKYRLAAQAVVVAILLLNLYEGNAFAGLLPRWAELMVLGIGWMWFINLFNFMDGSDGLAASEAFSICAGLFVLSFLVTLPPHAFVYSVVIAGGALGFLMWNWHPAKVFLGDSGSVPLGLLLGFMLVSMVGKGYWHAALILPAAFVTDATLTLLKRVLKGEKLFEAHSKHFYQRALRSGAAHDAVARDVIGLNLVLIALAAVSTMNAHWALYSLFTAYGLASALMVRFARYRARPVTLEPVA